MKVEAETSATWPRAEEGCQGLTATIGPQKGQGRPLPRSHQRAWPCPSPRGRLLQNGGGGGRNVCCFKPPRLDPSKQ